MENFEDMLNNYLPDENVLEEKESDTGYTVKVRDRCPKECARRTRSERRSDKRRHEQRKYNQRNYAKGYWYVNSKKKNREYIHRNKSSKTQQFYKHISNKIVRSRPVATKGNSYRKIFDYKWTID